MKKIIRIGIICPSEIALRRFMPALKKSKDFELVGVGVYNKEERFGSENISDYEFNNLHNVEKEKALAFIKNYRGKIFDSYAEIASSNEIDAIYIPLPPALHYRWSKFALEHNKHVLVEKPSTTSVMESKELVHIAQEKGLAFHENYMFVFHNQLQAINEIINSGKIGDVRLYRISFGFPRRSINDFRYNKALGGGALLDAGGYTIKYASQILGENAKILYALSNYLDGFEVDMFGSATLVNEKGLTVQIAFGMDNNYKCDLEVWGSTGYLTASRVLTAPADFTPIAIIKNGNKDSQIELPADDTFFKSIEHFMLCINNKKERKNTYTNIIKQAELIEQFKNIALQNRQK